MLQSRERYRHVRFCCLRCDTHVSAPTLPSRLLLQALARFASILLLASYASLVAYFSVEAFTRASPWNFAAALAFTLMSAFAGVYIHGQRSSNEWAMIPLLVGEVRASCV